MAIHPNPPAPFHGDPGITFTGWCWKGGVVGLEALASYRAGLQFKHLGIAEAHTGKAQEFPVLFRIWAHAAHRNSPRSRTVLFPEDSDFWVREVRWLANGRVCIGLEQGPQGEDLLEDFEGPFCLWLDEVQASLPAPSRRQFHLAQKPFARWATAAARGDAPISGILYDFDQAVRFASEFTGQSPTLVRKVLEARERYLELVGIAIPDYDPAEWARLEEERHQHRDLVPEPCGFIDDRETAYLVRITRLPRAQVVRAVQGETAYEDHLGLITWDSDEERAADLGLASPGPPEEWEAIFNDPQAHAAHLREVLARGRRLGSFPSFLDGTTRLQTVWLAQGPSLGTLGVVGRRRDDAAMMAAYPIATLDPPIGIRIQKVTLLNHGLEALVTAETEKGGNLQGLLPAPFAAIAPIQPGTELQVHVSLWTTDVERFHDGDPSGLNNDDEAFSFTGRVESLSDLMAWELPMVRLRIILPGDCEDQALSVFAGHQHVPHLRTGDFVRGQGQIILWPAQEEVRARTAAVRPPIANSR